MPYEDLGFWRFVRSHPTKRREFHITACWDACQGAVVGRWAALRGGLEASRGFSQVAGTQHCGGGGDWWRMRQRLWGRWSSAC